MPLIARIAPGHKVGDPHTRSRMQQMVAAV